jgi:hypothetical protein
MKAFNAAVGNDELSRSQLLDESRRALALGELILPWLPELVGAELKNMVGGNGPSK